MSSLMIICDDGTIPRYIWEYAVPFLSVAVGAILGGVFVLVGAVFQASLDRKRRREERRLEFLQAWWQVLEEIVDVVVMMKGIKEAHKRERENTKETYPPSPPIESGSISSFLRLCDNAEISRNLLDIYRIVYRMHRYIEKGCRGEAINTFKGKEDGQENFNKVRIREGHAMSLKQYAKEYRRFNSPGVLPAPEDLRKIPD